jgi:hypothetical protein
MLGDEFERYRFKTQRKNIEHIFVTNVNANMLS